MQSGESAVVENNPVGILIRSSGIGHSLEPMPPHERVDRLLTGRADTQLLQIHDEGACGVAFTVGQRCRRDYCYRARNEHDENSPLVDSADGPRMVRAGHVSGIIRPCVPHQELEYRPSWGRGDWPFGNGHGMDVAGKETASL